MIRYVLACLICLNVKLKVRIRYLIFPLTKFGPEYHSHDHVACPEALTDFFTMCYKIHGEGSPGSAKAQLDWQWFYKVKKGPMFSRDTTWTNAAKMGPEEWYETYVRPFHPELALVGMLVLAQVISASSCERNWSAHGQTPIIGTSAGETSHARRIVVTQVTQAGPPGPRPSHLRNRNMPQCTAAAGGKYF
jgi:hypothetical protein